MENELEQTLSPYLREKNGLYACSHDGFHPQNRSGWCALGCGSDYNQMINIDKLIAERDKKNFNAGIEAALGALREKRRKPDAVRLDPAGQGQKELSGDSITWNAALDQARAAIEGLKK